MRERLAQFGTWCVALCLDALRAVASHRPLRRWTARLVWLWTVSVAVVWLLLITTSESFLPAMLLAYGPRFVVLAPFVLLIPAALFFCRSGFPA